METDPLYIVLWLAFGIGAAIIAANRGHSLLIWFLLGLLFGPLALLVAFVLPRKDLPGPTRSCPFCAESIQMAATKCKHCGSAVAR